MKHVQDMLSKEKERLEGMLHILTEQTPQIDVSPIERDIRIIDHAVELIGKTSYIDFATIQIPDFVGGEDLSIIGWDSGRRVEDKMTERFAEMTRKNIERFNNKRQ